MKLFLDDIRFPVDCVKYMHKRIGALNPIYLEDWVIARNYHEFITILSSAHPEITHISYDHDLADFHYHESMYQGREEYDKHLETVKEKTGYDCAKWMKEFYELNKIPFPVMFVHSMNPVGTQKIIDLFAPK